jgi:hypothetical protein
MVDGNLVEEDHRVFTGFPEAGSAGRAALLKFCEENRPHVLAVMSWVAAEIADLAGFEVLFDILRNHGGTTFYIPHNIKRCRSKLKLDIPIKLHDRFIVLSDSNGCINVPSSWGTFLAIRRVAIMMDLKAGKPHRTITRTFGVTDRFLRTLVVRMKATEGFCEAEQEAQA